MAVEPEDSRTAQLRVEMEVTRQSDPSSYLREAVEAAVWSLLFRIRLRAMVARVVDQAVVTVTRHLHSVRVFPHKETMVVSQSVVINNSVEVVAVRTEREATVTMVDQAREARVERTRSQDLP